MRHQFESRMLRWHTRLLVLSALAAILFFSLPGSADSAEQIAVETRGGLQVGARVLVVSSLADSGPNTLRAAIDTAGPRIVVFDVAGYLMLKSDVIIRNPQISIYGQTAPDPGVIIRGASLQVRTHDVVIEHMAVYPGSSGDPTLDGKRDAISVIGWGNRPKTTYNVILRNLSLGWAPDENLSFAGGNVTESLVEHSLISEGLMERAHPRKSHSMGLFVAPGARRILVYGNILAYNYRRNPQLHGGSSSAVINNYIVGPGAQIFVFDTSVPNPVQATILANFVQLTAHSDCDLNFITLPKTRGANLAGSQIFMDGNRVERSPQGACRKGVRATYADKEAIASSPPVVPPQLPVHKATELRPLLLLHAGARPARRNPIDKRIITRIEANEDEAFVTATAYPEIIATNGTDERLAKLEKDLAPTMTIISEAQLARLTALLCHLHFDLGGPPNSECRR